jgi:uncharacterized damage-inducible protein DinB
MSNCSILAADNIGYLQQGVDLLGRLSDEDYVRASKATYGSGIGGHMRHCIDHYTNFLAGLPSSRIDYDARQRDPRIEKERALAVEKMREIARSLEALRAKGGDAELAVKMDCGDDSDEASWWSQSTVRRELQFLISHTVHHYALIGMILKFQGKDPGPDFGIAPSTLRYNQSRAACAR